ncbi:MAG: polysaccharide pyruvyl transferase family protein [bacterium]
MKIGVLTYFGDLNAGTNLQALCTLQNLKKSFINDEVEIINFHSWNNRNLPYLTGATFHSLFNDLKRINKYKLFVKNNLVLSKSKLVSANYFEAIEFIKKQNYDAIFVGADTLLELTRNENEITAYWLSEKIKCRKFLIAASSRNLTFEHINDKQKEMISSTINDFSLLGVRDKITFKILEHFVEDKQKIELLPDPTFTMDINYSIVEKYIAKKRINFSKPIIGMHIHKMDFWAKDVAKYFKSIGFRIASIRPFGGEDFLLNDMGPMEHMGIFKYFDLMITNKFHDTIFCLKNRTPMLTYPFNDTYTTSYGDSKYYNLLADFNLVNSNYMKIRKDITAEYVISKYIEAINTVKNSKQNIIEQEKKFKQQYIDFVEKCKKQI